MQPSKPSSYFTRLGPYRGYLQWLSFRSSLHKEGWQAHAQRLCQASNPLERWLSLQPSIPTSTLQLPPLIVALLGFLTMTGALSYSGGRPVNLWLFIGLFCALPFFLTLLSFISILQSRSRFRTAHTSRVTGPRFLARLYEKILPFNSGLLGSSTSTSWLLWQGQRLSIIFHSAAMVALFVVLFFNDVAFGWSSTIIQEPSTAHRFFALFSLPWNSLIVTPTLAVIESSQFFYHQEASQFTHIQESHRNDWWPHLLFGMFFYGLVPRILLSAWLKQRTAAQLLKEITHSADIQRFINACRQQTSHHAKMPEAHDNNSHASNNLPRHTPADALTLPNSHHILAWQQRPDYIDCKVLGVGAWQEDERWLNNANFDSKHRVYLIVASYQTPTAELSDTLALIATSVEMLVIQGAEDGEQGSQLKSWLFFAEQQNIPLRIISQLNIAGEHS